METTCNRCHQTIPAEGLYCPSCGLPQLVYSGEEGLAPAPGNQWTEALHEVGAVEWKPALRSVLLLAVPAGLIFGGTSFLGLLGLIWVAAVAAWAVTLYVRRQRAAQRPFWLTAGAGARIGLVTGLISGWIAFAATGASLYAQRFVFHQGKEIDDAWQAQVARLSDQLQSASVSSQDPQSAAALSKSMTAWLLSPEGKAGLVLGGLVVVEFILIAFAVAGGAVGARMLAGAAKAGSKQ